MNSKVYCPFADKTAVQFLFKGCCICFRYPAKLGWLAFQIICHCGLTYSSPYKCGLPYGRSTASPGLPAIYYLQA